jgi:hypothetical protein
LRNPIEAIERPANESGRKRHPSKQGSPASRGVRERFKFTSNSRSLWEIDPGGRSLVVIDGRRHRPHIVDSEAGAMTQPERRRDPASCRR